MLLAPSVTAALAFFASGPVAVQCPGDLGVDNVGHADTKRRIVSLLDYECASLNRFARSRILPSPIQIAPGEWNHPDADLADAMMLAIHEATHVRDPNAGEATVQCFAVRNVASLAKRLGARRTDRMRLARLARWSWREMMPLRYQSPC
ncbi:MAG: hypothetical protein WC565_02935 [Parcubacteria group bacterium]